MHVKHVKLLYLGFDHVLALPITSQKEGGSTRAKPTALQVVVAERTALPRLWRKGTKARRAIEMGTSSWPSTCQGHTLWDMAVVVKPVLVPFWGFRCATQFSRYFSGDWGVHWMYGILTHGHIWDMHSVNSAVAHPQPHVQAEMWAYFMMLPLLELLRGKPKYQS